MTTCLDEVRLVHLTEVRIRLDDEIAERQRLRARVVAEIAQERGRLARIRFLTRGARMSLDALVEHATAPTQPTTQEGHD